MNLNLSPSLMCMNLKTFVDDIKFLDNKIDSYHIDIMDGHYVKNITLSSWFISQIRKISKTKISTHLMMTNPEDFIIECINEAIISLLVSGVFSNHKLPTDEFVSLIDEIIHNPIILNDVVNKEDEQDECEQDITKKLYLLNEFENFYNGEPKNKSVEIVAQLYSKEYANNNNITNSINDYTLLKNNQFVEDVKNYLEYLENKEEKEVIK